MRSRLVHLSLVVASVLAIAPPAAAQGYFEVGGFGTAAQFDPTLPWDRLNSYGARASMGSGSGLGAFVLEGEASTFSLPSTQVRLLPIRARLLYTPTFGNLSVLLGGGAVRNEYHTSVSGAQSFHELGFTGLGGIRLSLGDYFALRLEAVVDYMNHPLNASATVTRNTNRYLQGGLSFPLWMKKPERKSKPVRAEPVRVAEAPTPAPVPEKVETTLPDADHDGVPDVRDACSNTASGSTVDTEGCPVYRDTDSDGVIDNRDMCPASPAGAQVDGHGCAMAVRDPDTDGDGVLDVRDRCADTPSGTPVNSVGCPLPAPVVAEVDSDHDTVPDSRDACPATPAGTKVDATGCALPLFKGNDRTVTLRGVNFEPWKDDLLPASTMVLDEVARQLIESPEVKVEIGGHTDASGNVGRNLRLSLARAETVRAYLVMKGVDSDRLVARGYGLSKPISSNATAAGRAMNRRVELRRLDLPK
jgi:outer membrane protein OmpA-like peptidoglycan-associated protein